MYTCDICENRIGGTYMFIFYNVCIFLQLQDSGEGICITLCMNEGLSRIDIFVPLQDTIYVLPLSNCSFLCLAVLRSTEQAAYTPFWTHDRESEGREKGLEYIILQHTKLLPDYLSDGIHSRCIFPECFFP